MRRKRRLMRLVLGLIAIFIICMNFSGCGVQANSGPDVGIDGVGNPDTASDTILSTATSAASPDLRGEKFSVLMFISQAEPNQGIGESIEAGVEDGVRNLNANGGIKGARIDLFTEHIENPRDNLIDEMLEKINTVDPHVVLLAMPLDDKLVAELGKLEIPILNFGYNLGSESVSTVENFFWLVPPPDVQFAFFLAELWQSWDQLRPSGAFNKLSIGYITSKPENMTLLDSNTIETFIDENNFDLPLRMSVEEGATTSTSNFLIDAITVGITAIYSDTYPPETGYLLNDLYSLAVTEFFVVGGPLWTLDRTIEDRLISPEPFEHFLVVLPTRWWNDPGSIGIQMARKIHNQYLRPTNMLDAGYLIALGAVDITANGLRLAAEAKGSGKIQGLDVMEQLGELMDYPVLGDLFVVDYSGDIRAPTHLRLWQTSIGGDWIPIGEERDVSQLVIKGK